MDIQRHAKYSRDPSRGFFSHMREIARQNVYSASFFWVGGSSNDLQPRRLNRFSRVIGQTTPFRARMCLFGVRRQKFNIYTP